MSAEDISSDPHDLIPPPNHDRVDGYVQRWVAGTNGNLYVPLINKLTRYPIPRWPARSPVHPQEALLDIGCSWGRWLVSAGQVGYLPVGIDIKTEALHAARRVLAKHQLRGYVVAADLRSLPFAEGVFGHVFSYSVLQHTHRRRCLECLNDIWRVLQPGGGCCLEFPIRHGFTNWRHVVNPSEEDDYESWCVRYYTWKELHAVFGQIFGNSSIETDCFGGIGVRGEDLDILPWKYKPIVVVSELLKSMAKVLRPVCWLSDSVFVNSVKAGKDLSRPSVASRFSPDHNLWILPWLVCPVSRGPLEYDAASQTLVSRSAGLRYPIEDEIPILMEQSTTRL